MFMIALLSPWALGLAFRVMNGLDAAADGLFGAVLGGVSCDSHSGEPRQDGMGRRDAICWGRCAVGLEDDGFSPVFWFLTGGSVALILLALKKVGRKDPSLCAFFWRWGSAGSRLWASAHRQVWLFPGWP